MCAVPYIFSHGMSIFATPFIDLMPFDLSCCFLLKLIFDRVFYLLQCDPPCSCKIRDVSPCCLVSGFVTFVVGNARQQGIYEEFSSYLSVVCLAYGQPDMLTSLDYADKPAECTCFYMHTWPELPYRGSLCLQIFHTNF